MGFEGQKASKFMKRDYLVDLDVAGSAPFEGESGASGARFGALSSQKARSGRMLPAVRTDDTGG